jgi:class 3 adenylate cyclase
MATAAFGGASRGAPKPSVGPRCQFCRQAATPEQKFCGACGAVLSPRCERRQAAVLFVDVCGFTAMSERLDPEDVRAIMERAFDVILDAVHAQGGSVNQFLGDGVMALFDEHVDDYAIRALRAAAAIQADLAPVRTDVQREHGVDFRVRAGVHTGPVTVGVIGRGLRSDYVSQGDTTNIAARLVGLAAPGTIAISSRTRELALGVFLLNDAGEYPSVSGALRTWTVETELREQTEARVLAEI